MSKQDDEGWSASILVVEDEDTVRDVVVRILERDNYEVFAVTTGGEALEQIKTMSSGPDVVLLDVVLPDMPGADLLRKLRQIRHSFRVLFISGFSTMTLSQLAGVHDGARFLKKPFTMDELLVEVRELLEGPTPCSSDN